MLKLVNIKKDYITQNLKTEALKGINIEFRKSEFVSILGPSGCGKTTLLNIIGGLDQYTSGNLIINNQETKEYQDRDWDDYRNHRIGFVFQSYNLIPHQTVLSNVELALTLSGVSKEERRKRAKEALKKVGLENQINKKPNQLSGGQMQRVAIARALVNDPEIILADEPTGALDTETSIQVMELLKEISNNKLIIMVTHNPELANNYATRIVKLLDGNIIDDSNPYKSDEVVIKKDENMKKSTKKNKKAHMSFFTALSLSLNNLFTKKGRTILTAFAGSIGIIGIALILSISSGFQKYIDQIQADTLSAYPLQITSQTANYDSILNQMQNQVNKEKYPTEQVITSQDMLIKMLETMTSNSYKNDLKEFKKYITDNKDKFDKYTNAISYGYDVTLNIYSYDNKNNVQQLNPYTLPDDLKTYLSPIENMMQNLVIWQEMFDNKDLLNQQYDLIDGSWPNNYNELVLVVDEYNQIFDYQLLALGLKDTDELRSLLNPTIEVEKKSSFSFSDIKNKTYKLNVTTDFYEKIDNKYVKISDQNSINEIVNNGLDLKISGIIRPKEGVSSTSITGAIGYSSELTKYVIDKINDSDIVKEQINNPNINIFTNEEFKNTESYEQNLALLQVCDYLDPSSINFYPIGFNEKDELVNLINEYNSTVDDSKKIKYTDYLGVMMSSISTIINAISYVLMAFVSVSLIVSSIMIGIITYISVLERTKEIGILRSIGASKHDVSNVFNAETLIIGFTSGMLGIIVTLLCIIPINILLKSLTNIGNLAYLPVGGAIILVVISMLLTVISGLFPAKYASKKDPVVALRSE